jgi:hypothetical protein
MMCLASDPKLLFLVPHSYCLASDQTCCFLFHGLFVGWVLTKNVTSCSTFSLWFSGGERSRQGESAGRAGLRPAHLAGVRALLWRRPQRHEVRNYGTWPNDRLTGQYDRKYDTEAIRESLCCYTIIAGDMHASLAATSAS